ncbi:MAG: S-methyl-5'-thioadenosine phosphorylase [Aggregatilineales bacterium]
MEQVLIGVIGGSGVYNIPEITDRVSFSIDTPFGRPSADVTVGSLRGKRVAFLPRHGVDHVFSPSTVPYRANIYALKKMGVRFIIGVNACGSLREDLEPGHFVVPDQLYDNTRAERGRSFFDQGLVAHISVAEPFCPHLSALLADAVREAGGTVHRGGTFVIIEGPRFSTRAESQVYRQLGFSIIGMTACPEAFLAREAEISYAALAHITDYDVWHASEEPVTVDMVIATLNRNVHTAQQALAAAVERLDPTLQTPSHTALENAIITQRASVFSEALARLRPIVARVMGL